MDLIVCTFVWFSSNFVTISLCTSTMQTYSRISQLFPTLIFFIFRPWLYFLTGYWLETKHFLIILQTVYSIYVSISLWGHNTCPKSLLTFAVMFFVKYIALPWYDSCLQNVLGQKNSRMDQWTWRSTFDSNIFEWQGNFVLLDNTLELYHFAFSCVIQLVLMCW
jgi:hypothetical protein